MARRTRTATVLFSDLVGSTDLLQRVGDERGSTVFSTHRRILAEAVRTNGGKEIKWLGDGLMVVFDAASDAARCAIAMQRSASWPAAGERLEIRVGLNVGEVIDEDDDLFGTAVVVARRLCDTAHAGEIFASETVARLLDGRQEFTFRQIGDLSLKGLTAPQPAVELIYRPDVRALLRTTPFVGREEQLAIFDEAISGTRDHAGAVILVAGEPGIGKTRLVDEACSRADVSGISITRGSCYDGEGTAPFRPWVEVIRSYAAEHSDDDLRQHMGEGAADILTLVPELRSRFAEVEEAPRLDPDAERFRLFDSVTRFLASASDSEPLIVFLDDLQWADRPSLGLLRHAAKLTTTHPLVYMGTYRDAEVDTDHPLKDAIAEMHKLPRLHRLVLEGLSKEAVDDLLATIGPATQTHAIRQKVSATLHDQTDGNPLFLREMLTNLVESGAIEGESGRWSELLRLGEVDVPAGVTDVIERRLQRLSKACNDMLARLALAPTGCSWDALRTLADSGDTPLAPNQLVTLVDEALSSQMIVERTHANALTYSFTHALVRQTVYTGLSGARRTLMHEEAGRALERLYGDNSDTHAAELAYHFYYAAANGCAEQAVRYCQAASDRAMATTAYEDAIAHGQRALEAYEQLRPDANVQCRLLTALAEAQLAFGAHSDAAETAERAVQVAADLPDVAPRLIGRATLAFGRAMYQEIRPEDQLRVALDHALRVLPDNDGAYRVQLLPFLAWLSDRHEAGRINDEAIELAISLQDPWALIGALQQPEMLKTPQRLRRRLAVLDELASTAAAERNKEISCLGDIERQRCLFQLGDAKAAADALQRARTLAEELRQPRLQFLIEGAAVMCELSVGRLDEAAARLQAYTTAAAETTQGPEASTYAVGQVGCLLREQGKIKDLAAVLRPMIARDGDRFLSWKVALSWALIQIGEGDEAKEIYDDLAAHGFRRTYANIQWNHFAPLLGELCTWMNDRAGAAILYDMLLPCDGLALVMQEFLVNTGAVGRTLGQLAAATERWNLAEKHFQEALALDRQMGSKPWVARTLNDYAHMLHKLDPIANRTQVTALAGEGLSIAEELRMPMLPELFSALLA